MDGLNQASELFKGRFKITARGSSRSFWAESSEAIADVREKYTFSINICRFLSIGVSALVARRTQ